VAEDDADLRAARRASEERESVIAFEVFDWIRYHDDVKIESTLICLAIRRVRHERKIAMTDYQIVIGLTTTLIRITIANGAHSWLSKFDSAFLLELLDSLDNTLDGGTRIRFPLKLVEIA
jgi:hypothetical protein